MLVGFGKLGGEEEIHMTWKDKMEIGLKEDAPYRKDNLSPNQVRGPEIPSGDGRSPEIPMSRTDENQTETAPAESSDDLPPQD